MRKDITLQVRSKRRLLLYEESLELGESGLSMASRLDWTMRVGKGDPEGTESEWLKWVRVI